MQNRLTRLRVSLVSLAIVVTLSVSSCAKARHIAVVADATFAAAVFAVDDAEFKACQTNIPPFTPEVCAAANPKIKQALLDVKAVTAALQATPKDGPLPKDLPSLMRNLIDAQAIIAPLAPSLVKQDIVNKITIALNLAVSVLSAFTGS